MTIRTQDYSSIITTPPAYTDPDYIEYGPPPAYTDPDYIECDLPPAYTSPSAPLEEAVESKIKLITTEMIVQKTGDLDQIPTFTRNSINILQNQMHVYLPPLLHTGEELTGKIQSIAEIKKNIQTATDNSGLNAKIACVMIAVLLTFVALTVLGSVFSISALFIAGLTLLVLDAGVTIPVLCMMASEVPSLKYLVEGKEASLQYEISSYKEENIKRFYQGYSFYKEQTPELLNKLDSHIKQSKKTLVVAEQLPEVAKTRLSELRVELAEYENARDQLIKVANFHQYNKIT